MRITLEDIQERLKGPLPGIQAHAELHIQGRPTVEDAVREHPDARRSAVALVLHQVNDELIFPLIQRPSYPGVHSGQVGLPGGKEEEEDQNLEATALREYEEELGPNHLKVKSLGELSPIYIPPSNFLVFPYVFLTESPVDFTPDKREVDSYFFLSVHTLMDLPLEKTPIEVPRMKVKAFQHEGHTIWGATALILNEFKHLLNSI